MTRARGPASSLAGAEDGHAAGADEGSEDDQDDAEDHLALEELDYSDHDEDGCDDPENCCVHG